LNAVERMRQPRAGGPITVGLGYLVRPRAFSGDHAVRLGWDDRHGLSHHRQSAGVGPGPRQEARWQAVLICRAYLSFGGAIYGPGCGPFAKVRAGTGAAESSSRGKWFSLHPRRRHCPNRFELVIAANPMRGCLINLVRRNDPAPPQDVIRSRSGNCSPAVPARDPVLEEAEYDPAGPQLLRESKEGSERPHQAGGWAWVNRSTARPNRSGLAALGIEQDGDLWGADQDNDERKSDPSAVEWNMPARHDTVTIDDVLMNSGERSAFRFILFGGVVAGGPPCQGCSRGPSFMAAWSSILLSAQAVLNGRNGCGCRSSCLRRGSESSEIASSGFKWACQACGVFFRPSTRAKRLQVS